jgi:hypothetical protein
MLEASAIAVTALATWNWAAPDMPDLVDRADRFTSFGVAALQDARINPCAGSAVLQVLAQVG